MEPFIEEYCPNCERMTTHDTTVVDELFDYAIECLNCHVVYEAVPPSQLELRFGRVRLEELIRKWIL